MVSRFRGGGIIFAPALVVGGSRPLLAPIHHMLTQRRTKLPVSVTILTRNEESLIGRCIASAAWADEVLVLDSGSTDRTRETAGAEGANVYEQTWLGWVAQHQAAIELARHDWILVLDADEIVSERLARSIIAVLESDPCPEDGYVVDRRDEFLGELMLNMRRKRNKNTLVRLFNRTKSRYRPDMLIHEAVDCPGRIIELDGILIHWRNSSLTTQFDTYNRHSDLEAQALVDSGGGGVLSLLLKPPLRFAWIYMRCGHWRFGMRGLLLACMHAHAEFARQAKAWVLRNVKPAPHPPLELFDPERRTEAAPEFNCSERERR